MKETNLYYTIEDDGYELDLRELPFISKLKFSISLLRNRKIFIPGENKFCSSKPSQATGEQDG